MDYLTIDKQKSLFIPALTPDASVSVYPSELKSFHPQRT